MCGIAGFLSARAGEWGESTLVRMADAVRERGPDAAGYWFVPDEGVGLGHRRLSVLDLSSAGSQPMQSPSGRYVLVLNGEIYNHDDLRQLLQQGGDHERAWRGHSDTETMVAGFDAWGIRDTVSRCLGMFAFAVWDRKSRTLTLARDRVGEKPLYFGWAGDTFLFGSQLKSLRAHPAFRADVDRGALSLLLRHNAIPAPYSIYKGVSKLLPGTLLTVSLNPRSEVTSTYWSAVDAAVDGAAHPFDGDSDDGIRELDRLLRDAVRRQMMADVPLGAFLSGGVDSSAIVALMQAQSSRPVKTFSIGFEISGYDEAPEAKAVARHLGTDHAELYVTADAAMSVIPRLPEVYDEPFADSSQIPTMLVSNLARRHVTVSLSGDAGDELFCGYNRYSMTARHWSRISRTPLAVRRAAVGAITAVAPESWDRVAGAANWVLPAAARVDLLGDRLHKAAGVLASESTHAVYRGLVSHWTNPASVVVGGIEPPTLLTGHAPDLDTLDPVQRMMALDLVTYLPDDILAKVDRASMSVSLESRVPFLDHRVVEFAWRLPQSMKLRDGQTKWILRQLLNRYVPQNLVSRPKHGFGIPLHEWLRVPLRDWAEALLDESRLRREGYFHPEPIRKLWAEHLSGRRNWAFHLWDVLMFQAWREATGA
jgi:asparagine synthase (glutamine-hydrolysing)